MRILYRSLDKRLWDMPTWEKILIIIMCILSICPFVVLGAQSLMDQKPPIKIHSILEQTDTYVVVQTDVEGNFIEGYDYVSGDVKGYVSYKIQDKEEYKYVRVDRGSISTPIIDGKIKVNVDENDKYICFKKDGDKFALVLEKDSETNTWKMATIGEKLKYSINNLFAY